MLKWLFTVIAVVMLVRLSLVALHFAGVAIGWLGEGNFFERFSSVSPQNIAIQIAIIAIVLMIFVISKLSKRGSDKNSSENSEQR